MASTIPQIARGTAVTYTGAYVNMRGPGTYLTAESGSGREGWHVLRSEGGTIESVYDPRLECIHILAPEA